MNLEQENKMINNWEVFSGLIDKLSPEASKPLGEFVSHFHERIIPCPASTNINYVGAFTGGLVWHSLNVLKNMKELVKLYDIKASVDELIIVGLFHDIGKIGATTDEDYYLSAKSQWHADNGLPFQINPTYQNATVASLSLSLLNQYKVPLTYKMIEAINSTTRMSLQANANMFTLSPLSMVLQQGIQAASIMNKGKKEL